MTQRDVELILVRQLASYLTLPMFVVDAQGALVYVNEAAEPLLGRRFDEIDELTLQEWSAALAPTSPDGRPLTDAERPLLTALREHRPAHGLLVLTSLTGDKHTAEVTAFPLIGQGGRALGAVALFWVRG